MSKIVTMDDVAGLAEVPVDELLRRPLKDVIEENGIPSWIRMPSTTMNGKRLSFAGRLGIFVASFCAGAGLATLMALALQIKMSR